MLIKGSEIRKLIREELERASGLNHHQKAHRKTMSEMKKSVWNKEGEYTGEVDLSYYDYLTQEIEKNIRGERFWGKDGDIEEALKGFFEEVPEPIKKAINGAAIEDILKDWKTAAPKIKSIHGVTVNFSNNANGLLKFVKHIKDLMTTWHETSSQNARDPRPRSRDYLMVPGVVSYPIRDIQTMIGYTTNKAETAEWTPKTVELTNTWLLDKLKDKKFSQGDTIDAIKNKEIASGDWDSMAPKITQLGGKPVSFDGTAQGLLGFLKAIEALPKSGSLKERRFFRR